METNNKQREALGKILWCLEWMFNNTDDKSVQSHLIEPIALAKAALAAPPRNCDVGTAEEQNVRHNQFCYAQMKRNNHCCGPCPCYKFINGEAQACTLIWAQMPYEEGGNK